MHLTLSDDVVPAANLSEADLRLALFQDARITLTQGARLASLDRLAFQHQLAARKLQIHYREEEFDSDMRTIEGL
jgi:predicted HTH domain antitoxin